MGQGGVGSGGRRGWEWGKVGVGEEWVEEIISALIMDTHTIHEMRSDIIEQAK